MLRNIWDTWAEIAAGERKFRYWAYEQLIMFLLLIEKDVNIHPLYCSSEIKYDDCNDIIYVDRNN